MDDPLAAVVHAAETGYELIIINLDIENVDGLRLCSQLKSLERTRQTPILIIVDPDDHQRLLRGARHGRERLSHPPARQSGTAGARQHPDPPLPLHRAAALQCSGFDGNGGHRCR